jgi:hypothetical protein
VPAPFPVPPEAWQRKTALQVKNQLVPYSQVRGAVHDEPTAGGADGHTVGAPASQENPQPDASLPVDVSSVPDASWTGPPSLVDPSNAAAPSSPASDAVP